MTATQSQSSHQVRNVAVGSYIESGTAVAITITTGFKPRYIKVVNETGLCMEEWFEGMTAAHAVKTVDSGSGTTDIVNLSSNGITVSSSGFTIGVDTDINVTAEQLRWIAMG
jgi:hypothetical protein